MKIGGLQPVTLLDYPQKVAAIIFTSGCNMRCPFCYNPDLVLPDKIKTKSFLPKAKVFDFLERRKQYLDGLVITGGEPAQQPGLLKFCQKVKKMGYLIKIDTNGLLPQVLDKLIDKQVVDYIAMDIKGPLSQNEKFCGIKIDPQKIKDSIKIIKNSGLDYEFRSTLVKSFHSKDDIIEMAKLVSGAKKYFLQNFNPQDILVGSDFKGKSFTSSEMKNFCRLASEYVEQCQVR